MYDFLDHIRSESDRFHGLLDAADEAAPVDTCPGWSVADLRWHLAEVQHFWSEIVGRRLTNPDGAEALERPALDSDLPALGRRATQLLIDALVAASDDEPAWSWSDDETVGFTRRRQAHEALIHRVDAERVLGIEPELDESMAADGVEEILRVFIGGVPVWADFTPDGATVRIESTGPERTWGLAFGRMTGTSPHSGTTYDLPAATVGVDASEPDAVITGPAAALDLWLWGRGPMDALTVTGDESLATRLRELAVEATQ